MSYPSSSQPSRSPPPRLGAGELKPGVAHDAAATPAAAATTRTRRSVKQQMHTTTTTTMNPHATPSHRVQSHHFPLYSHPMFRAAAQNSAAVRTALDAEAGRIDHAALDAAVERMVEDLLQQQQQQHGAVPVVDVGASEAQLLALLANVSRPAAAAEPPLVPPPASMQHFSEKTSQAVMTSERPADTFAATTGLRTRPLPHPTRHMHDTHMREDVVLDEDVQVVSVGSLQRAAMAYTHRTSELDASLSASTAAAAAAASAGASSAYVSSIPCGHVSVEGSSEGTTSRPSPPTQTPPTATTSVAAAAAGVGGVHASVGPSSSQPRQHSLRFTASPPPPQLVKSGLYSFLPNATTVKDANMGSSCDGAAQLSSGIAFSEMDRRPGCGTGPVAQQAVDMAHLSRLDDAVFAAMDVLMDGNSCCVRRRRRRAPAHGAPHGRLHHHNHGLAGYSQQGSYALTSTGPMRGLTVPPPPRPPRTAAEAKARRILDAQRRRQRPAEGEPKETAGAASESARASVPARPVSLPPLPTMRGLASQSLFDQALHSTHHRNAQ